MTGKLFCSILIVLLNLGVVQVLLCHADDPAAVSAQATVQETLVPNHEIKYQETRSPDWKTNWDIARSLYRDKRYPEALVQYEMLFTQKENIDEARWEYVSILLFLKRWDNAKVELEKLLATEPESTRYRLAMATVNRETGNIENAVSLYVELLGQAISETDKIMVLEGLLQAREVLGQKDEAATLLGQLISLKPQDLSLLLRQAALELELGNVAGAKELCNRYDQSASQQDVAALALHARIEEKLRNSDNAAAYWQQVITLDPDNTEAHQQLYDYYFANSNWAMSFNHLEALVKMAPNDVLLLARAAELNLRLGRVDWALKYYEYALAVDPLNRDIAEGKKRAQKILAQDMLVLVENDGGKKLWQDLVHVAPDCDGIYREMANLLREQGKVNELIEVLMLLNKQLPEDQLIYDELATLLEQQGQMEKLSALRVTRSGSKKSDSNELRQ